MIALLHESARGAIQLLRGGKQLLTESPFEAGKVGMHRLGLPAGHHKGKRKCTDATQSRQKKGPSCP
jgi:hypothetical protein